MRIWWLSFVDPSRPEGSRFLGATIIADVSTLELAILATWSTRVNPGGQVGGHGYDIDDPILLQIIVEHTGRLLTQAEVTAFDEKFRAAQIKELTEEDWSSPDFIEVPLPKRGDT